MIVSFAWTTSALLDGLKTVTRRTWADGHAKRFYPGREFEAWDKSPYIGGKRVAVCRVVSLRKEKLARILTDWEYGKEEIRKEGGLWPSPRKFVELWVRFGSPRWRERLDALQVYRLEFEVVSIG